jgi:hypothetical protein
LVNLKTPAFKDQAMATPTRTTSAISLALGTYLFAYGLQASVSPQEAAALGSTLTAFGAERAGNADGSIPEYTGGLPKLNTGSGKGEIRAEDPYAGDKPLRVITAANAEASASQLTAGTLELLRRHPTFRVDVYPTHRSAAYPAWLLENTRRNATAVHTTDGGLGFTDALPGIPFPIPADGSEVMWNHRLRYMGRAVEQKYESWLVDGSGQSMLTSAALGRWEFPLYDEKHRGVLIKQDERLFDWKGAYTGPQRRAGEAMLLLEAVNPLKQPRTVYSYVPGQRRAKLVNMPDDAPSSSSSGAYIVDDAFVFNGSLDRYDVKLLGKREMLVPYNNYRLSFQAKPDEILRPGHLNPDVVRWELHRVWVVEATLKPGQHHPYGRRVFYVDEDTWIALASDEYDTQGKLLRAVFAFSTFGFDTGVPFTCSFLPYSFDTGGYYFSYHPDSPAAIHYVNPLPDSGWSPDALAGEGVR